MAERVRVDRHEPAGSGEGPASRPAEQLMRALKDRRVAERRVDSCVQELRSSGASWALIGRLTGTSRQAARQRWGPHELV